MSDNLKPRTPPRAPFDSQFPREESHVRARRDEADTVPPPRGPAGRRLELETVSETVAERTTRIDRKLTVATLVLERLSPTDPRARLLSSAMFRRDEVLLDAVLAQMTDEVLGVASKRRGPSSGF
jgi:hypothetical protein